MNIVKSLTIAIGSVFLILLVAGFIFDAPVLFGYIKSTSMEPTVGMYDLIFINPLDRNFGEGDIVIFRTDDEWICHRIVGLTAEGFITKGDANIVSDQFSGKRPVQAGSITGKVLTFEGNVVKISGVGSYIQEIGKVFERNKVIVFVLLISGGLLLSSDLNPKSKKKVKNVLKIKYRTLYLIVGLVLIVTLTLASVGTFETRTISYGTTAAGGKRPNWVLPSSEFVRVIEVENRGSYPYYYVIKSDSERAEVVGENTFLLLPGESESLQVIISAPSDTALHSEKIRILKYVPLLPPEIIKKFAEMHVFLPVIAVDAVVAIVIFAIYVFAGRGEEIRIKGKSVRKLKKLGVF